MSNNRNIQIEKFAEIFKALSNPNRLRIFMRLVSCCSPEAVCSGDADTCIGELGRDLGIVPSTVSHHIKELHRAGLIRMERNGQRIECRVDYETLCNLANYFESPKSD